VLEKLTPCVDGNAALLGIGKLPAPTQFIFQHFTEGFAVILATPLGSDSLCRAHVRGFADKIGKRECVCKR
jgi:hypothetical protein